MTGIAYAVCADFVKVRGTLRAFDWPVSGFVLMGDGWIKGW